MKLKKERSEKFRKLKLSDDGLELVKVASLLMILKLDGRTQEQIAEECQKYEAGRGIVGSVISEYANEKRPMGEAHARVIAHVLGVRPKHISRRITKDEFIEMLDDNQPHHLEPAKPSPEDIYGKAPAAARKVLVIPAMPPLIPGAGDTVNLPFYSELRPAAGKGAILDREHMEPEEWIPVPAAALKPAGHWFVVDISGDSMSSILKDGDRVACREEPEPKSGQVVVATHDGGIVVKLYEKRVGQPDLLVSMPEDGDEPHPDIECVPGQTFVHAVVVWRLENIEQAVKRKRRQKAKVIKP